MNVKNDPNILGTNVDIFYQSQQSGIWKLEGTRHMLRFQLLYLLLSTGGVSCLLQLIYFQFNMASLVEKGEELSKLFIYPEDLRIYNSIPWSAI